MSVNYINDEENFRKSYTYKKENCFFDNSTHFLLLYCPSNINNFRVICIWKKKLKKMKKKKVDSLRPARWILYGHLSKFLKKRNIWFLNKIMLKKKVIY